MSRGRAPAAAARARCRGPRTSTATSRASSSIVAVQEEEARQSELGDERQFLVQPCAPRRAADCPPGSARRSAPVAESPASLASALRVLGAGVAVAEVLGEVEAQRLARRAVSATASGWSAKRAAIACGEASTWAWLPRRSGSEASSVVCSRMATNASCSRARGRGRGRGRCPSPRTATPGARRSSGELAVQRAVVARERALQLDAQARRARTLRSRRRSVRLVAHALARAAAEADEALGVLLDVVERDGGVAGRREVRVDGDAPARGGREPAPGDWAAGGSRRAVPRRVARRRRRACARALA